MHRELAASLAHVADALADPMPQASQNILKATGRLRAGEAMQCNARCLAIITGWLRP